MSLSSRERQRSAHSCPALSIRRGGRRRERDWAPGPLIKLRPLKTAAVFFSQDVFPNHLSCLSIILFRQSSFHLNIHSSSTRASLRDSWSKITLIYRGPHSCRTLVFSSRFSLSSQSKKSSEENWFEHVLVCFIYFLPQCSCLQRSSPPLGKVQMHSFPWQSTR